MTSPSLARRLSLGDAVFIGLGSMIGAGVFSAFAPAAVSAGSGLLVGLVIAAVIAFCNAASSAQLAAQYPVSGGTYIYGRERLGEWWGFAAGWSFVIGKTASCAAMALTFAAYVVPGMWQRPVAALAVAVLVTVNSFGVTRTAALTRMLVVASLGVLTVVAATAFVPPTPSASFGWFAYAPLSGTGSLPPVDPFAGGWYGILQAAGLLFFAFAGYARIATMGEEVRYPSRTIPRAIVIALGITVVVYAVIAVSALRMLGPAGLAEASAPLAETVAAAGWGWVVPVVGVGAACASLGALLALIAGVGRTSLAMAREGDLPRALAAVDARHQVPRRAEVMLGIVVVVLVLTVDLRSVIGFSSFGVLLYYLVANVAAFTQGSGDRRFPRWLQVLGATGCVVLVVTLPPLSIAVGVGVLAVGLLARALVRGIRRP